MAARGARDRQGERMGRVDVLVSSADRDLKACAGFRQGLEKLGWSELEIVMIRCER
jgi:hypothetical protein